MHRFRKFSLYEYVKKTKPVHPLTETKAEIQRFLNAITEIRNTSPNEVSFRLIKVQCEMIKDQLIGKAQEITSKLLNGLAAYVRRQNEILSLQFQALLKRIKVRKTHKQTQNTHMCSTTLILNSCKTRLYVHTPSILLYVHNTSIHYIHLYYITIIRLLPEMWRKWLN